MTVYVSKNANTGINSYSQLLADSLEELHQFAKRNGICSGHYHGPPLHRTPHYALSKGTEQKAVRCGATRLEDQHRSKMVALKRALEQEYDKAKPQRIQKQIEVALKPKTEKPNSLHDAAWDRLLKECRQLEEN